MNRLATGRAEDSQSLLQSSLLLCVCLGMSVCAMCVSVSVCLCLCLSVCVQVEGWCTYVFKNILCLSSVYVRFAHFPYWCRLVYCELAGAESQDYIHHIRVPSVWVWTPSDVTSCGFLPEVITLPLSFYPVSGWHTLSLFGLSPDALCNTSLWKYQLCVLHQSQMG